MSPWLLNASMDGGSITCVIMYVETDWTFSQLLYADEDMLSLQC